MRKEQKINVAVIGLGLIGGSMALSLTAKGLANQIVGVDGNAEHESKALALGLVQTVLPLQAAIAQADLIVLAVPVNAAASMVVSILDAMQPGQVLMDVGSTKAAICDAARSHANRSQLVATHPMWGTEHTGPTAAQKNAFDGKAAVICEKELSDAHAVAWVENMYTCFGMHLLYMDATAHDLHAAYVSHISHITSFALANTVLEKEREENTIFELASGGFESTVRLAKSNAAMWVPIFQQNKEHVLDVLNEHISQLRKFKSCLEKDNFDYLKELIEQANKIKRILP
jgi:prephenate dehydrogenase